MHPSVAARREQAEHQARQLAISAAMYHHPAAAAAAAPSPPPPASAVAPSSSSSSSVTESDPRIEYLGTHQFDLGGASACAWTSVYTCLYLVYSSTPKRASLVEHMRRACQDWNLVSSADLCRDLEGADKVCRANRYTRYLLVNKEDWFGLAVPPEVRREHLPAAMLEAGFELDRFPFCIGFGELVQRVVRFAGENRTFAFTLSCRGSTMCVGVRRLRDGQLRFDLVDSHQQALSLCPPPNGRFQAVWVSTRSPVTLLSLFHEIYPPSGNMESVEKAIREPECMVANGLGTPSNFFSVSVFVPRLAAPPRTQKDVEEAEKSVREEEERMRRHALEERKKYRRTDGRADSGNESPTDSMLAEALAENRLLAATGITD